jgi:hypothetical protein
MTVQTGSISENTSNVYPQRWQTSSEDLLHKPMPI